MSARTTLVEVNGIYQQLSSGAAALMEEYDNDVNRICNDYLEVLNAAEEMISKVKATTEQ